MACCTFSSTEKPSEKPIPGQHPGRVRVATPGPGVGWQRGDRHVQHLDVIGGGVAAGVARAQQPGQRLATGDVRAVQVAQQRVEAEALLPGRRGVLLLRVRGQQARVEVEPQHLRRIGQVRSGAGRPGPLPRRGPCRPQEIQPHRVDPVHHPPRGRVRGDRPEQLRLIPQRPQVPQRVPTVCDGHRQIHQHLPGRMRGRQRVGVDQRGGPALDQTGLGRQLAQQRGPSVRHDPLTIRGDLEPTRALVTLHLKVPSCWGLLALDKPDFPLQTRHFRPLPPVSH